MYLDSLSKESFSQNLSVYEVRRSEDAVSAFSRVHAKRFGSNHVSLLRYQRQGTGRQRTLVDAAAAPGKDNRKLAEGNWMILYGRQSLHLHDMSGSQSRASSALRRQGPDPHWLALLPRIWLFLHTGEFVRWTKVLRAIGGTADVEGMVWVREVVGRLRVVFDGQLKWLGRVLDHSVYLEEEMT